MITTNKKNYFKAGQTYCDAVIAVSSLLCFFVPFFVLIIWKLSGTIMIVFVSVLLILCIVEMLSEYKQYSHSKKIIISSSGFCIIEKKKSKIIIEKYCWNVITNIKLDYSRYIRGGLYLLCIDVQSYSSGLTGTKKEKKTIVVPLTDYLSYIEQDFFAKNIVRSYFDFILNLIPFKKKTLNRKVTDIDSVLSHLCKEKNKRYCTYLIDKE